MWNWSLAVAVMTLIVMVLALRTLAQPVAPVEAGGAATANNAGSIESNNAGSTAPRVLPEGKLPDDSRLGPLNDLNGYFPFTPPASANEWHARAEKVRRQMLVALGLWPMPQSTPLNAVVHGRIERDGYTVEKVYFESYPGHFVTGSLYRPTGRSGKLPGVLCPHGHFPDGRFGVGALERVKQAIEQGAERSEVNGRYPMQAACAQLARMGCVTLIYDMVGYADSVQIPYQVGHFYSLKRAEMELRVAADFKSAPQGGWGFFSTQADLRLQGIMGLQTYNSIRALDFLCSLPDVDTSRIGVTGASSGGTQTLMLCAVDPRPAVAVPIVMVSTAMQGGCTCENSELLRIGTGNVEFAALFAPKPQAAICANDWTKEIATKGGPELQQLYTLLGAKDGVLIKPLLQFGHNFNCVSREAMYAWMNRHLRLGLPEPVVEQEIVPLAREEMTVWDNQHPQPEGGEDHERSLLRTMTDDSERQLARLVPHDETSLAEFRRVVGGAWEVMIGRGLPKTGEVTLEQIGEPISLGDYQLTKGLLRYLPNREEIPVVFMSSKQQPPSRTAIWLDRAGKAGLFDGDGMPRASVRKLLDAGTMVVGLDLVYQGEFLADGQPVTETRRVVSKNNRDSAAYTFGYNHAVFAQRVHDVLTAIAYFSGEGRSKGPIDLVGLNGAGHWTVAARAIAAGAVDRVAIDTGGFRFANVKSVYDPDFLPGAAKYFDIPGLLALCAPGRMWLCQPDGSIPPDIWSTAYIAAGAIDAENLYRGPAASAEEAAIEWLLRN